MSIPSPVRCRVWLLLLGVALAGSASDWSVWGGPQRDFQVRQGPRLMNTWPAGGPHKLWERPLGDGYSGIAVQGDTLYTMYRRDAALWQIFRSDQEVVIALDARTGRTKWEFAYDVRFRSDQGSGPHVMPQVAGGLLFSVGATGKLHALRTQTGELVWKYDLYEEFGATRLQFGYSSHPLLYKDRLIAAAGGKGKAVVALDQRSGRVIWARHSFRNAYSSPVLLSSGGRNQIVILSPRQIMALDPDDGRVMWTRSLSTDPGMVFCTTPLWDPARRLLVYSAWIGTTALRITGSGPQPRIEEAWRNQKLRSVFSNLLLVGDAIYMARGSYSPGILHSAAIDSGQVRWSARGFGNANLLLADGKVILLDEDGWLTLANPEPDGSLRMLSRAQVLRGNAWTIPALAGTTLYLRDRRTILALDLGAAAAAAERLGHRHLSSTKK